VPPDLTHDALAYAEKKDRANSFVAIHSETEGEVGRVVLDATKQHNRDLWRHHELDSYVGHEEEAKNLSRRFKEVCMLAVTRKCQTVRDISEIEIIKNEPNSSGQKEHMDAFEGTWNFLTPLVSSVETNLKHQNYQDYPVNMGPYSTVPRRWADMPDLNLRWNIGDLLMVRGNAIHAGPPNGPTRRYVLFAAESAPSTDVYSDTLVVTEEVFFNHKRERLASRRFKR
jgi:hypothetical protein